MGRIEKTVFISYRRTNFPWALAIFQDLNQHGYDVFFDFLGINAGDFESVIIENIKARAHFVVLLTPSALERCGELGDWLRREIETALEVKRNIIPLMLENFDFGAPGIGSQLTGDLEALKSYNGLRVPPEYFLEAMSRLREKYLSIPLDAVLHPASRSAKQAAVGQKVAAASAPQVQEKELTAGEWFERGFNSVDSEEQIRCYSEAILLKPDYAYAFNNRGIAHKANGDLDGALQDYNEAIRLKPDYATSFYNRGNARKTKGDLDGALQDYNVAIRLKPDYADALYNRGIARKAKGDLDGALQDYNEAIRLKPDYADAFYSRGIARKAKGDLDGALQDYNEAIRLRPDYADAFYNRAGLCKAQGDRQNAASDYQRYLDLGGGKRDGDQAEVEKMIRDLKNPPAN
jgi:tetratricopeptide (TPR) repeat protein